MLNLYDSHPSIIYGFSVFITYFMQATLWPTLKEFTIITFLLHKIFSPLSIYNSQLTPHTYTHPYKIYCHDTKEITFQKAGLGKHS